MFRNCGAKSTCSKPSIVRLKSDKKQAPTLPIFPEVVEVASGINIGEQSSKSFEMATSLTPRRRSVRISERLHTPQKIESDIRISKVTGNRANPSIGNCDIEVTRCKESELGMAKRSINTKVSVSNGNQKVVEETLDHTENQTLNEKERVEVVHENIIEVLKANRSVLNEKSNSAEAKSKDETFATSELPEGANTKKINLMEHGQITKDSAGGNNVDTVSGTCTSFVEHKKVSQVDGTKESVNEIKCSNEHSSAMLLGRRKSGKFWKGERDRFRSVIKSKGLKQACAQKRIAQKEQYLRIKGYEKGLKEESKRIKEEHRQRREDNKKRKLDNEKKNEVVQIIKNTAKIKRMKKKQLRMLAKRDVAIIQR